MMGTCQDVDISTIMPMFEERENECDDSPIAATTRKATTKLDHEAKSCSNIRRPTKSLKKNNAKCGVGENTPVVSTKRKAASDFTNGAKNDSHGSGPAKSSKKENIKSDGNPILETKRKSATKLENEAKNESNSGRPRIFREGQHVWVLDGKETHAATVKKIHNCRGRSKLLVRVEWQMMGTCQDVDISTIMPMFEERGGEYVASVFSKRSRAPTNHYSPPSNGSANSSKKGSDKCKKECDGSLTVAAKRSEVKEDFNLFGKRNRAQTNCYIPPSNESVDNSKKDGVKCKEDYNANSIVVAKQSQLKEESASFVREMLQKPKIPSGVAPGPGWTKTVLEGKRNLIRWISPKEKICFQYPRAAFEFEEIRQTCQGGDELQALETFMKVHLALGKWPPVLRITQHLVKAESRKGSKKKHKKTKDEDVATENSAALGPGWKARNISSDKSFNRFQWISPQRKIVFRYLKVACQFEEIRKKCGGDELRALEEYVNCRRQSKEQIQIVDFAKYCLNGASVVSKKRTSPKNAIDKADSGWTTKSVFYHSGLNYHRVSPQEKIEFRCLKPALEFEEIKQQYDGDEVQAFVEYARRKRLAGERLYVVNPIKHDARAQGRGEPKIQISLSTKSLLDKTLPVVKEEEDTDSFQSLDSDFEEEITAEVERDYAHLYDYYLRPITRHNEELPSGMILRKKSATCNLLRYKNSTFRRKLHQKIVSL